MRRYRDNISSIARDHGRDPAKIRLMHLITPVLADTVEEARAKKKASDEALARDTEALMAGLSYITGLDMSQFPLDEPLPDVESRVNGHQSSFAPVAALARTGLTYREVLQSRRGQQTIELVGTPETVADEMESAMEQVGGDGFMVVMPFTRRNVAEIADGLAPVLRRRGLIRDGFPYQTFKENLQDF
jgi:alkanesulfonate monooxygenase SsuD/methylene tetrahydromethanopterin reductase-like flavin-dependent oxidoreductase (luciferase family)